MNEQTLVVMKPDGVVRGLTGEVITRFEKVGLKIVAAKMLHVSQELADNHYPLNRDELWTGIGQKTLDNYEKFKVDAQKELGTADAHAIGLIIRTWLMGYITAGPVFAMVIEGPHAVEMVRKICGNTLGLNADPGTIRGDYSHDSSYLANTGKRPIKNIMHASGNLEEAEYEVPLWFTKDEIVSYKRTDEEAMY